MARSMVVYVLLLGLVATGCASGEHWYFSKERQDHVWGYSGDIGPEHWGSLDPDYHLADDGREQSPIDIVTADVDAGQLLPVEFRYSEVSPHWVNNGHTLQHGADARSHIIWSGRRYDLAQYHLHTPSEHAIDGLHAPAELHLVHKDSRGNVLVVGVLITAGDDGDGEAIIENAMALPHEAGEETDVPRPRNPQSMLPESRHYVHYRGSFTTPPCTESVDWIVLTEPIHFPEAAIREVELILGRNNRPLQPLNGRKLWGSL